MVKVETRIQLAIKEILEEETWKYLKTKNNFDKVFSIASLIEPFDEGPDPCYEDCRGMCFGCYDGYKYSLDWRASYNLRDKKPFSLITDHELDKLIDALVDKVHTCDERCSDLFVVNMKLQVVRLGSARIYSSKKKRILNTVLNVEGLRKNKLSK